MPLTYFFIKELEMAKYFISEFTVLRNVSIAISILVLFIFASGCEKQNGYSPESISLDEHMSGNEQCGRQGSVLSKPLKVVVHGSLKKGLLGGKGTKPVVPNVDVTFEIENPESGAVFAENDETRIVSKTNAAGQASAKLKLGNRSNDINITASVDTPDGEKAVRLRASSGIEIIGEDLEGPTGGKIDQFGVRLQNPSGKPAEGVAVYFRIEGTDDGSKVGKSRVYTDKDGQAVTSWKLGKKVRQYFVSVEIQDTRSGIGDAERFQIRPLEFTAMGTDKKQMLIILFGGLAVFILGMKTMSDGLKQMADRRLKSILQAMTRNSFLAVAVGAGLTAMVQSSSATTVMTVGFVNAGLVTLKQAIGVIFGANIGTTITAQIIAFKLTALAYPAIAIGLILATMAKKPQLKAFGNAVLGFGLLFLGMQTMSGILKPLKHSPEFIALFRTFDCTPVAGGMIPAGPALMCIVIGTVTTVVIQSSSATVGLVLALSSQGLLSFYTAVPLILGDNIGTTITAVLASLGANRNAKRTALAHTFFNVFGAVYMYVLLFIPIWNGQPPFLGFIDAITPGEVFTENPENLLRHVANAHTAFNIFNCILFFPFIGIMVKVCEKVIPITDADTEKILVYLEPQLLKTPPLALKQAVNEVAYMVRRAQKSLDEACEYFCGGPSSLEEKVLKREDVIDELQKEITQYLVSLSHENLLPYEAALIPALIHAVNDAERIGDHSEDLVELTQLKNSYKHRLSQKAFDDINELKALLDKQFVMVHDALLAPDDMNLDAVNTVEKEITDFVKVASEGHTERLGRGECDVQAGVIFLDVLARLERVGDHLVNIAERADKIKKA